MHAFNVSLESQMRIGFGSLRTFERDTLLISMYVCVCERVCKRWDAE